MNDRLLNYYERELTFLREMGAEFARKYPKIAGRLLLEPDKCEDPHTERLIEATALIGARIRSKIDDDFPEITASLLNIIYPHYIRPIPSLSIATFEPIHQNISAAGYRIEKDTPLYSKPVGGTPCQFRTCYPVDLYPVHVDAARLEEPERLIRNAQQVIYLGLETFNGLNVGDIQWRNLRFFLNGPSQSIYHLHELILNHACHVECTAAGSDGKPRRLDLLPEVVLQDEFDEDQGLMPFPHRSFPGYLHLFEYFCFPEKFLFFTLNGLDKLKDRFRGGSLEIRIYIDRVAEPIRVDRHKTEYRVIPDLRRPDATEIFAIDRVTANPSANPGNLSEYKPFYSIRRHLDDASDPKQQIFWHIHRRYSGRKDDAGTEVYLSFTDAEFSSRDPGVEILTLHTTCTNRDLPARLPFGDPQGDFDLELAAPVEKIICRVKPTLTRRSTLAGALQWRLISHLSLNYLSLVEKGGEALKEVLNLYNFDNAAATRQQINGIASVDYRRVTRRIGRSFCRGMQVEIEFDENKYVGAGLFLFASVLERFLGQYVSINSFSQLVAKTVQQTETIKQWPPRAGNLSIL